ncbi:ATP-binding protein [Planctomonas sp. JC2975]|uniref:sensor histidine kinase n=1 Tax=Planctomonas sp. JC2975 TaxID=2729626 RepID=UPI001472723B|nr:ATP-binding protein [Planctomonas sp. JC2975]NNC12947.1 ATP-binding protein [Planctomonas sp. JC2975]
MSLGVPAQVAREAGNRAVALSTQVAALSCLIAAVVVVLVPGLFGPGEVRWWAACCLLPMAALLVVLMRRATSALCVAYVVVGSAATFVYTIALLEQTTDYSNTNLFVVALPLVALMLVGGSAPDARIGVLWATLAYAVGDLAVFAAALGTGREFRFDSISLGAYVLFMALLLFHGMTRGAYRGAHTLIMRTLREQRADELRRSIAAELRAELHDTTLSELAAIAAASPGPVSPALRERLEDDIRFWTTDAATSHRAKPAEQNEWRTSELAEAIAHARDSGLVVDVSGDHSRYARLPSGTRRALGLAARQCLINVLKHSGQSKAEVMLSASDDAVSLVVVDGGRGFDVASLTAEGNNRMGLRHSVIVRIERVGGSVSVFSRPGEGTSVLMIVPTAVESGGMR